MNVIQFILAIISYVMVGNPAKKICRKFQTYWNTEYFFIERNNLPLCLICALDNKPCNLSLHMKSVLEKHYKKMHLEKGFLDEYPGKSNRDIYEILLQKFNSKIEQDNFNENLSDITKASYVISDMIARNNKCYSEGEFIKTCMVETSKLLFPDNPDITKKFESICLSRRTVTRRINEIAQNILDKQKIDKLF